MTYGAMEVVIALEIEYALVLVELKLEKNSTYSVICRSCGWCFKGSYQDYYMQCMIHHLSFWTII